MNNQEQFEIFCGMGKYKQAKRMIDDGTIREISEEAFNDVCAIGATKLVKLLLDNGAVPTDQSFLQACHYGHPDVVALLMEDGRVDVTAENCLGLSHVIDALMEGGSRGNYLRIKDMLLNDNRLFLTYFCGQPSARCWVLKDSCKKIPKGRYEHIPKEIVDNIIDMSFNFRERYQHVRRYLNGLNQESIDKLEVQLQLPLDAFDSTVYDEPTFRKILTEVFTIQLKQ